jgi:hypothetical protein
LAPWAFVAALSWLVIATIGFVMAIIFALTLFAVDFAAVLGLTAAVIPFLVARGILLRSATVGLFASVYALGLAIFFLLDLGPSTAIFALLWLVVVSAMATRESLKRS